MADDETGRVLRRHLGETTAENKNKCTKTYHFQTIRLLFIPFTPCTTICKP